MNIGACRLRMVRRMRKHGKRVRPGSMASIRWRIVTMYRNFFVSTPLMDLGWDSMDASVQMVSNRAKVARDALVFDLLGDTA